MLRSISMALIVSLLAPLAARAAEEETKRGRLNECVLYTGQDGKVWVGKTLVGLGMIGVAGFPPVYRLSPALAEQFRPLVNDLKEQPKGDFWIWGMPRARDPGKPLVVVEIDYQAQLRKYTPRRGPDAPRPVGPSPPEREYEITAMELIDVEFITPRWREAWDGLDAGLKEIVAATCTPPGDAKRQRLQGAIDRSSQALGTMVQTRIDPQFRTLVAGVASKARVVRTMQQDIQGQWGGQLRQYAARLRIAPAPPLPPEAKPCPALELFAASKSPAEFLAKIRASWPDETLDQRLMYAQKLDRFVYAWQVADLTPDQFAILVAQAKEQLDRTRKERESQPKASASGASSGGTTIDSWGVVLRPADADLLAKNGLLQGTLVESVTAQGSKIGLRAGDIILGYGDPNDLVMGEFAYFSPLRRIQGTASYGGKLEVLRGDRVLTIEVARQQPGGAGSP